MRQPAQHRLALSWAFPLIIGVASITLLISALWFRGSGGSAALPDPPPAAGALAPIVPPVYTATPAPELVGAAPGTPAPTSQTFPTPGPSRTPRLTRTPNPSGYAFVPQLVAAQPKLDGDGRETCNWFGIGGQAYDLGGGPAENLLVHLETGDLMREALTGSQPAIGPAGYEIVIGDRPAATSGIYDVQLRSVSGAPLSEWLTFDADADCSRNLIVIDFRQVR